MGLPTWAVGRTAAEGFQLAQQLYQQSLAGGAGQGQRNPSPQPATYGGYAQPNQPQPGYAGQPVGPQGQQAPAPPTDDDWAANPGDAARRYNDWYYQQNVAPQWQQSIAQQSATALDLVRERERDAFQRWEPEIMMHLGTVDRAYWTTDNIRKVVGLVKADHLDELASARADAEIQRRMEAGTLARPSDGAAGAGLAQQGSQGLSFNVEELPPERRAMMESARLIRDDGLAPAFWEFIDKTRGPAESRESAAQAWWKAAVEGDVIVSSLGGRTTVEDAR